MIEENDILTDTFGRRHNYLRISVIDRCDLRCIYCMPSEGIQLHNRSHVLTVEEIVRLANIFATLGVNKVRITGGEPMVRRGIETLIKALGEIPSITNFGITTNGILLSSKINTILDSGINYLNLSLDTFKADRFFAITRRNDFEKVMQTLNLALDIMHNQKKIKSLKLNCVPMAGVNDDEILDFVEFTKNNDISIRFIEYMPFSGNGWDLSKMLSYRDMLRIVKEKYDIIPTSVQKNDTAVNYMIPGYRGTIGFITSMTNNFCSTCNRLRLTADGKVKNCLFDRGELNLRDPMRSGATDKEIIDIISLAVKTKKAHHGGFETPELIASNPGRSMIEIGG